MIGFLIFSEIILRFFGTTIPGVIEIVIFCMVSSAFMALAQTLRKNEHIRITVLIGHLPLGIRRWFELWCLVVSAIFFGSLGYYTIHMAVESYIYNEMSDGVIGIPLWIPQVLMFWGIVLVTVAFVENAFRIFKGGLPVYVTDADENPEIDEILHHQEEPEGSAATEKRA